jgi:predicted MFS family arabinose efflux permease
LQRLPLGITDERRTAMPTAPLPPAATTRAVRAFLFGNFVIGSGVLVVPGMLPQLADGLRVSVPTAGQLIGLAALVMSVGAPLVAALTSRVDRRRLLVAALVIYCAGHLGCALASSYASMAGVRVLTVVGAAIFTPQAAATIGAMAPPERRSAAVTAIFLGWSVASVAGMPLAGVIAARFGWQGSFVAVALVSAVAALWVARVVPPGITVPPLSLASWRSVLGDGRSRIVLAVTLVAAAAQFTLLSYVTPALRELTGQSPNGIALLLALFGGFGILGNAWISRRIGSIGPDRAVFRSLALMIAGLAAWALAGVTPSVTWPALLAAIPLWGLGCFAANSAQQARLVALAPPLASASIALNTSCIYAGQAVGAALGGALIRGFGLAPLASVGAALMAAALLLSARVGSRQPAATPVAPKAAG